MKRAGEGKAHPGLVDAAGHHGGATSTGTPSRSKKSNAPDVDDALPVAVLAHTGTGARDHEAGHGRDVERVSLPYRRAAGAHDVDRGGRVLTQVERRRGAEHRPHHACHLGHRLALHTQGDDERRDLRGRRLAAQDLGHAASVCSAVSSVALREGTKDARPPAELIERHRSSKRDQPTSRKSVISSGNGLVAQRRVVAIVLVVDHQRHRRRGEPSDLRGIRARGARSARPP